MNVQSKSLSRREHHLPANGGVLTKQQSNGGIITRSGGILSRSSLLGGILASALIAFSSSFVFAADTEDTHVRRPVTPRGRTPMKRSRSAGDVRRPHSKSPDTSVTPDRSPDTGPARALVTRGGAAAGAGSAALLPFALPEPATTEDAGELARVRVFEADTPLRNEAFFSAGKRTFDSSTNGMAPFFSESASLGTSIKVSEFSEAERKMLAFSLHPDVYKELMSTGTYSIERGKNSNPVMAVCTSPFSGAWYHDYPSDNLVIQAMSRAAVNLITLCTVAAHPSQAMAYNPMIWVMDNLANIVARFEEIGGDSATDLDIIASIMTPLVYRCNFTIPEPRSGEEPERRFISSEVAYHDLFTAPGIRRNNHRANRYMFGPLLTSLLIIMQHFLETQTAAKAELIAPLRALNNRLLLMNEKEARLTPSQRTMIINQVGRSDLMLSVLQAELHTCGLGQMAETRVGNVAPTLDLYNRKLY